MASRFILHLKLVVDFCRKNAPTPSRVPSTVVTRSLENTEFAPQASIRRLLLLSVLHEQQASSGACGAGHRRRCSCCSAPASGELEAGRCRRRSFKLFTRRRGGRRIVSSQRSAELDPRGRAAELIEPESVP